MSYKYGNTHCNIRLSLTFKLWIYEEEKCELEMPFIGPWEVALIAIVVILLFGVKRIPQLAKSIGEAVRQYRKATESDESLDTNDNVEALIETAKQLGLDTEGKTPQEISDEILKKMKKR